MNLHKIVCHGRRFHTACACHQCTHTCTPARLTCVALTHLGPMLTKEGLVITMNKIISYVVIAFCYRKANILCRWSNILCIFYWKKGLCHCCRSYRFWRKLAIVHYLQTVHCWLPLWQNSCIISSRLMVTPYAEDMLPLRFQETAQSEQHCLSNADIEGFIYRKLKDINQCTSHSNMPKDGRERYVLFFKITSEIKT